MNEGVPENVFIIEKSPIKNALILLGATDPHDLFLKYVQVEQKHFKDGSWDYNNSDQVQNIIKETLESVNEAELTETEAEWRNQILWFWYHHAVSIADRNRDKEKMKQFSENAIKYEDESNILTRTMYLLCHDKIDDAEKWTAEHMGNDDYETSVEMVNNYKKIGWLWPQ